MRSILFLLMLAATCSGQTATYGGRTYTPENFPRAQWCSCSMCASIRYQWAASEQKVKAAAPKQEAKTEYRIEYRSEPYQVKVCRNGICTIETRYRQVAVKVPIQQKADPPTPEPKIKPVTELIPTPMPVVQAIIEALDLSPGDVVIDAGCGDGRFLVEAAKKDAIAIGVEIDADSVAIARERIESAGVPAVVFQGDALDLDYSAADVVVIYQMPDLLADMVAEIPDGVTIASYAHEIPGVDAKEYTVDGKKFWIGIKGKSLKQKRTFGL